MRGLSYSAAACGAGCMAAFDHTTCAASNRSAPAAGGGHVIPSPAIRSLLCTIAIPAHRHCRTSMPAGARCTVLVLTAIHRNVPACRAELCALPITLSGVAFQRQQTRRKLGKMGASQSQLHKGAQCSSSALLVSYGCAQPQSRHYFYDEHATNPNKYFRPYKFVVSRMTRVKPI